MVDIFLSYSSKDRPRVEPLARLLQGYGWDVWWDQQIPIGKTFDEVIGEALGMTKCVLVIWSHNSVESNWVKEEASVGMKKSMLIPILLDRVLLPLGFSRIEAANLTEWKGQEDYPEFELMIQAIEQLTGKPRKAPESPKKELYVPGKKNSATGRAPSRQVQPKPTTSTAPRDQKTGGRKRLIVTAVAITAVVGVIVIGIFLASLMGDKDGDGVSNLRDECPNDGIRGSVDSSGCPEKDSDGDGVLDNKDDCPGEGKPGEVDERGCLSETEVDSDGDGVLDNEDLCIDQGDQGNGVDSNGCPIEKPEQVYSEWTMVGYDSGNTKWNPRENI